MKTLWLDLESYSEIDLKATGVYPYAASDTTEITLFAYAIDDGPVQCWDVTANPKDARTSDVGYLPDDLARALFDDSVTCIAHNAQFDRVVLRGQGYNIPIERWRCSMVLALCHALPAALSDVGKALGLPEDRQKLADGTKLVHKFCKPTPKNHKIRRYTRDNAPVEWARFIEYAKQDVAAMRDIWQRIPNLNYTAHEVALWHLDQHINDRGFQADVTLAHAGASAADVEKNILAARLRELTNGIIVSPTKRDQLLAYVNAVYALAMPDMTKDTIAQTLKRGDLDPVCREILEIRLAANKTSTAKYAALVAAIGAGGRFRGGLQFAGAARTRRFAGRIFQPQNLPSRGLPKQDVIEGYITALKNHTHDLLCDDLMLLGAASLRGLVIAPSGKKLVVADLSNIEGRILAWVAGEEWKLQAFRQYDAGTGPDLYNITAVSIIGGDPWKVGKTDRNVFGKVPDLASGYRGGVPGYQTFAHAYGVRMADHWDTIQRNVESKHIARANDTINEPWAQAQITTLGISDTEWLASESCKLAWRARHPATVAFWNNIQTATINAVQSPGEVFTVNQLRVLAKQSTAGNLWLYIKLPSGKFLTYFDPQVSAGTYGQTLTYMSMASDGESTARVWGRTFTHGGKLTGNVCQTLAGDLLKENMPVVEAAGYRIVLTVHDEVVCEAPDSPEYNAEHLASLLATSPAWADGLPLSAAGFECYRYRKE